jgi:3-hydroxyisobutyrate dehydrogenase
MTTVAVLGTGLMGAGMARSLLRSGAMVRVWNRTPDKAAVLERDGATAHPDPATAVAGADVVVSMVFDADAVESVMSQALPALPEDAVWLQTATVGLDATRRLADQAESRGIGFVDAPVLGTRAPAEQGTLVVLAAGPSQLRSAVQPVLEAIGSRTIWVGDRPGDGHRLKMVANSWVLSLVGATAQAVGLAEALDIDPKLFLEAIAGGPSDCAYMRMKAQAMIDGEFPASFTVDGAVKDSELIGAAMRASGVDDALMAALHKQFSAAAHAGHAEEDMAAVITVVQRTSPTAPGC